MKLQDETITLLSIKDIGDELSDKESESWNKLSHVLTHEIMNTIAPIISLSQTLSTYPDINEKAVRGLRIIQAQSERLLQFTESFRHLSYLPKPEKKLFSLTATLQNLRELLSGDFKESNIIFTLTCEPKTIYMKGDENQLSQVLLNLLKTPCKHWKEKKKAESASMRNKTNTYLLTLRTTARVFRLNYRKRYLFLFYHQIRRQRYRIKPMQTNYPPSRRASHHSGKQSRQNNFSY